MKRKRRLFGILLIITALIIMQLPVSEADAATSASDFKIEGSTLVEYRGTEKSVSIPGTVTVIAEGAFSEDTKVVSVSIPDSVTKIEEFAFWGCDTLESVGLGKGLEEIGDYAFANCKGLTKVSVPANIRSIGIQAFLDCVNLTDITIRPETINIHESAFDGCYKLTIHCEEGSYADQYAEDFYERQKEMPEYEDVEDYLTDDVSDGDSDNTDTEADEEDASGTLLGNTFVVGNQAVIFVDNTSLEVLSGSDNYAPEISEDALVENVGEDMNSLPKYTIVDGKTVADQAYYRNNKLKKVVLPEGIEEIGQFSFARSTVTVITIPEGVTDISYGAFYHCDRLAQVELPETVENVEPKAFVCTPWVDRFLNVGTSDYLISGGVLVAYRGSGSVVNIPDGVRVIAAEAFAGHEEIQEVVLPDSVLVIGEAAFEGCTELSVVICGEQLQKIKDRAFAGCSLEKISLPYTVAEIGIGAFDDNVELAYAGVIPDTSHELSAERLSNEAYRNVGSEKEEAVIKVSGVSNVTADLEGIKRTYTLSVTEASDNTMMSQAYDRCFKAELPQDIAVYDLQFTDNSGIPITKLGKQSLKLTIPITEGLLSQKLQVYALDRNGQLELVEAQRVRVDGVDCLRFKLDYLSQVAIVGTGSTYDGIPVIEETTSFVDMAEAPGQGRIKVHLQWSLAGALLFSGLVCLLWRKKRI